MQKRSSISREGKIAAFRSQSAFPTPLTSFVGREQETAAICELLRRPEVRLVTLTGVGGIGKTRLGLQVAARLGKDFADERCFVSLVDVKDPEFVLPTIGKALGLQETGNQTILDLFKTFLQKNSLFLVLDDFEQVIGAVPALSNLLKVDCDLKILAMSREVLRISGEYTFWVPPLEFPDLAQIPNEDELLLYPSITLFLERTRSVLPEFSLNEKNSRIITEICAYLDGIPLAIELAVSHLKMLSPKTLLNRLESQFQVLTHGMRDAPERQQTFQNTLEWSYRLLNPREQQIFRFLSVFAGGCTLQAAETIWEQAGFVREHGLILKGVASLIDKSMLYPSAQDATEPRLLMLRMFREYGLQLLWFTEELEQCKWSHAIYYVALAEEAELELQGPQARFWLERLEQEHDNLSEVFRTLISSRESKRERGIEMALRLGTTLEQFWIIKGHVQEGREMLEHAWECSQGVSPLIRGKALCVIATLACYHSDLSRAMAACQTSLDIFRELGEVSGIARSLYQLGYINWLRGDLYAARQFYEESLAISQEEQYSDVRCTALLYYASLALFQRDIQTARLLIEQGLDISRKWESKQNSASALNILGWVTLLQKDIATARCLQEESLILSRELGNQRGIAHALSVLGEIACVEGDVALARKHYEESLAIMMHLEDRWWIAIYMEGLARVAVAQGEALWAVYLLSASLTVRQKIGAAITPLESEIHKQTLVTLQEHLGDNVFADAWEQGQAMSPQEALVHGSPYIQIAFLSSLQMQSVDLLPASRPLHEDLTPRERDVLCLVALGLANSQVAERLVISRRTVNFHLTSIYQKLQVPSRGAAVRYAMKHHLFEEQE
ncbi:MAG TPA: LuxR C-terminal-related transcriptional regulator [Ktedonobacteraceae bacterium]|nr:LuxR C-terminal-related transcriptional regulator [Ktedonobacteraceae bacterium]